MAAKERESAADDGALCLSADGIAVLRSAERNFIRQFDRRFQVVKFQQPFVDRPSGFFTQFEPVDPLPRNTGPFGNVFQPQVMIVAIFGQFLPEFAFEIQLRFHC